ncbi:hypothetical protein, variant 2 [Blastomyces dermatitidis ER-3]|uniref:Uncharacterized protein n=1 Tax=Ajellomyces dermatitidis (strain ER-3 / ATCC MYA-2586) TaxID=559297 RepID=A0ABX2VTM1_AJEDR|nr:hypothetical protein, variant 2 [Blastomyces dermatitidis ER-3]OAT00533.1 hypothetical protein, variant 2 [Blastomyces dermatitidis ER-3]
MNITITRGVNDVTDIIITITTNIDAKTMEIPITMPGPSAYMMPGHSAYDARPQCLYDARPQCLRCQAPVPI